jgi:hypothetical protein
MDGVAFLTNGDGVAFDLDFCVTRGVFLPRFLGLGVKNESLEKNILEKLFI